MKAIIFDIDWVVIKWSSKKHELIFETIKKYNLDKVNWVKDILNSWFNRKILLEKIYEIHKFDLEKVLEDINKQQEELEKNAEWNKIVINFIKENKDKFIFSTNTSLPRRSLDIILRQIWLESNFNEFLAYEDWSKKENIEYILKKYNLKPEEVLFIDDKIKHIERVKSTNVNLLYYTDYKIDIKDYI